MVVHKMKKSQMKKNAVLLKNKMMAIVFTMCQICPMKSMKTLKMKMMTRQ